MISLMVLTQVLIQISRDRRIINLGIVLPRTCTVEQVKFTAGIFHLFTILEINVHQFRTI